MDFGALTKQLMSDGTVQTLAVNPRAQFGANARRYIGAELLPERTVMQNAYREIGIKFRTVMANSGTRYSPAQKKGADIIGSFLVELGNSDIASEFTSRDLDALIDLLMGNRDMQAAVTLTEWVDRVGNLALVEYNEKQRWDAIVAASVVRTGDNNYTETIGYSNPANHRAAAGGTWSNNSYDPWADITAMSNLLASKGYTPGRIITSTPVLSILANNNNVKARVGLSVVNASGQIVGIGGRATRDALNGALERDNLPPIETYDLQYRTQTSTGYFLARNVWVMVATTGRDETIDFGDTQTLTMQNTLGYVGVGRAAGQSNPGRVMDMQSFTNKPPRIQLEAWQTSLPVILEPEAITVINSIS